MVKGPIQVSAPPRAPWRLLLLAVAILGFSSGSALLLWFDPLGCRVTDNERVPGEGEQLQDQAIRVQDPDVFRTKGTLNLPDGGRLEFRYGPISDSGVQLRRFDRKAGSVRWEQECAPLGVGHSAYYHDVFVQIEGRTVKVISRGSYGTFVERLDLDSGKRLARSVRKKDGVK